MEGSIADINQKIENCKHCRLHNTRINAVCGEGIIRAKFMFKKYELKVPTRIGFRETFGTLYVAKNKKIVPVRHPATVVHKSKQLSKLIKDYNILNTLQSDCPLIFKCSQYKLFNKGLLPFDFAENNCFGNWKECRYSN